MPSADKVPDSDWDVVAVELAERLRTLRKHAGFTQEALSYAAGLDKNTVQNIERARNNKSLSNPTIQSLFKIAFALNIPVVEILPDAFHHVPHRQLAPGSPSPSAIES
ncbi:helix-turn-helix domain-containing protein [Arthrobacter cavernae]|uniref:Helix-turn-helix transcriptional regulator n=1 Tax=Arthrobacter cavernae TaxID=2817681 RepID=A0A939HKR0_9MICC|nr:helix-turn-helix transcriptional regulator [Arthrobacter cavernae]MBO1269180.1 helix-turn-helix transcriptional regulator [Arthrobacter cavernae]